MKSVADIIKSIKLPTTQVIKERITSDKQVSVVKKLKKKGPPQSGLVVFQHNNLIEANYSLTLQEKRVILWLISQIQPTDEDFKKHTLTAKNFMELVGLTGHANYTILQKITLELMQKVLTIKKIDEYKTIQVAWLCSAVYEEKEGFVELSFAPEMQPFLLALKSKFTAIKLSDLMNFSSIYAVRIYELLKQYEDIGERTIEVENIRKMCGIQNKLKQYKEFKQRLILMAQREINLKSDIHFEFEEIKRVRKIVSIKFIISKNKNQETKITKPIQEKKRLPPLFFTLEEYGLSKRIINKIIKENPETDILNAIQAVEIQMKKGVVKNPKAMLISAIKENWHPEVFRKK